MIQDRQILEASARDEDVVLGGIFDFTYHLLSKFDEIRVQLPDKLKIVQYLTHQGLFEKEKKMVMVAYAFLTL
jgi:hypothetical protein